MSALDIRIQNSSPIAVTGNMSEAENQVLRDLLNFKPGAATDSR